MASLFDVEAGLARALTHGFHSYAGRMHPSTARTGIARLSKPGQLVLDPFCGSGTVLVEAMAGGRRAMGVDASPLAVLVAQVRSRVLDQASRARLVEEANKISEAAAERARKRIRPEIPAWARREIERFSPHVALELLGLRELVAETADDPVGRALRACFSSILVKFMRQPEGEGEGEVQRIGRGVPSRFFARRADELARSLEALAAKTPPGTAAPEIHLGDARHLKDVPDGRIDLVLSSPPYAGVYDYAEHHDVRFLWLGLSRQPLDERQVGARGGGGMGSFAKRWRQDRRMWLGEMGRVTRPGAHLLLVVGDGVVGDEPEDAAMAVCDEAPKAGMVVVAGASQARPARDRRLVEIFAEHPRREHMVLLRKQA